MTIAASPRTQAGHTAAGVHATARIRATSSSNATILPVLAGDGPFDLRRNRSYGAEARVCITGAMSAPLGGDRLRIEATAEQGAHLHITTAAATIALRGATPEHATYDVQLTVAEQASLHWLPQPLISTARSNLRQSCTIDLAPTARLVLREEQVLGRAGEPPGRLSTRLTVRHDGRPLLDQQTRYGPDAPGWNGPAVLAGHRAAGQILIVDPAFGSRPPAVRLLGDDPAQGQAVLTPLAGPALLVTALAPDSLRLRRLLDAAYPTA
ncbi:urease accessory protein UreD [Nonomuraea recticatena]|uniref:Urease accessory protein UreD n=1 Tax=Nonomuraea recticatena TaxID=46178 RepID=A0ABP6FYI8_9ACTN